MNIKSMRTHILAAAAAAVLLVTLSACGSGGEDTIAVENAFHYTHVDGHRNDTEKTAFVLFEFEELRTVKYQVAYVACTCRGPEVNYWSVAFVKLDKNDGSVVDISYELDDTDHYVAGLYGDSETSWDGTPVRELFDGFIEDEILDKTQEEINSYEAMHGEVDAYTGATVTPNNAMRMLQGLFTYHNARYGS